MPCHTGYGAAPAHPKRKGGEEVCCQLCKLRREKLGDSSNPPYSGAGASNVKTSGFTAAKYPNECTWTLLRDKPGKLSRICDDDCQTPVWYGVASTSGELPPGLDVTVDATSGDIRHVEAGRVRKSVLHSGNRGLGSDLGPQSQSSSADTSPRLDRASSPAVILSKSVGGILCC